MGCTARVYRGVVERTDQELNGIQSSAREHLALLEKELDAQNPFRLNQNIKSA
ncbi:MAG: hypothetical protein ACXVQ1_04465 [Actinomycetota bacterium]